MTSFPNSSVYRGGVTAKNVVYADDITHTINREWLTLSASIPSKGGGTTVVDFEISSLDFGTLAHLMMMTDAKRAREAFDASRRRKPKV